MTVWPQPPMAASTEALIVVVAATLPPPSQLTSYSSPLPQIPSPPFPVSSPPTTSPTYTKAPLGYRAAGLRLRTATPPPLPLSSPLPLPPPIILPYTRASMKRLCIAPGPRYEIGESSFAPTARSTRGFRADYDFVGTLDAEIRRDPDREVGYGITDVWVDPDEITKEIPATNMEKLDDRSMMIGQLNLLRKDRRFHARTARLIESEARVAREAWAQAMDASDTVRSETQMVALQSQ
ncbi:hypothetical protein Tco_0540100 [Tanacetum coccineum]